MEPITLESILQAIHQRNRDSRAEASQLSARLQTLIISEEPNVLEQFERELEERYRGLLESTEQDSDSSGVDRGTTPSENGTGNQP